MLLRKPDPLFDQHARPLLGWLPKARMCDSEQDGVGRSQLLIELRRWRRPRWQEAGRRFSYTPMPPQHVRGLPR
ncbi:hypothetical protein [Mumia zhuanghuii]|uniref:Uncharacterized protein n=1 Tax=Mumia zhuanghuii TaxID=2585211 RepID=A0A5C4LSZ4_9ACTN|nr:hypothetical protein [Mumia zhuanghuii]TNC22045.1 hypothetical protein FHE65_36230 [Mumia zhuanghuii]TNC22178.1 hypothetical protein FHE65_35865 [Mumia zhuanghuii]